MRKIKIICVAGPTASGKTALGTGLAKAIGGEIVSADSMQVYKGMPIASAVPTESEKENIPHHLMEFLEPEHQLTVAEYVDLAHERIKDINARGKTPIVVGGTGLYIDSLVNNIKFTSEEFSAETRKRLEKEYDEAGGERMLDRLREFDKEIAEKLYANDKKRIVRAFEIYENTGVTMSKQYEFSRETPSPYDTVFIGINYKNRELLYERINKRVDKMVENGLIEEARKSFEKSGKSGGFQAIGHKEFYPYFKGEISERDAIDRIKQQTRRYAKRQLTWFRKNENINWIYADESKNVLADALEIIERSNKNEGK